jgi:cystathionine beta-lyase/cystathionine gamma-synthase
MPGGYGAVVSFEVKGGFKAASQMANNIKVFSLAVSLGGVESLIQHPASMTHSKMSEEELLKSGIRPALIRISVGIEDSEDQLNALAEALEKV